MWACKRQKNTLLIQALRKGMQPNKTHIAANKHEKMMLCTCCDRPVKALTAILN
jgi:hypothetical protein